MSDITMPSDEELIEKLAAIEHQRWADWQQWVFDCCEVGNNGDLIIPAKFVRRWWNLIYKPYTLLIDKSKQSDRDQVMRYWPLLQEALHEAEVRARIDELLYLPLKTPAHDEIVTYRDKRLVTLTAEKEKKV